MGDVTLSIDVPVLQAPRTGITQLLIEERTALDPDPVITKAIARAIRGLKA